MNELVAEERFVCVGVAVVEEGDARVATCIVEGTLTVVATANVGVVADETQVHPPRG